MEDWLFCIAWDNLRSFKGRLCFRLFRLAAWFAPRHPFNPWRCDSCRFEAKCGYESENEREVADAWRREKTVEKSAQRDPQLPNTITKDE